MPKPDNIRNHSLIDRGNKRRTVAGTATFFAGRFVEPVLQYGILRNDWGKPLIKLFRGSTLPQGPPLILNSFTDRLGLSPYRTILFSMSVTAMVKHNYHVTTIMQENMPIEFGAAIPMFHAIGNGLNSLLFVCAQTSASTNGEYFPQTPLIVGSVLFVSGLTIEWLSEQQRHDFKRIPANEGRLYRGGLFSLSRHINYFGYTLWRVGYALAAGGWLWSAVVGAMGTYALLQNSIPELQHYMEKKYGEQFEQYKKDTPYKFIPWVC